MGFVVSDHCAVLVKLLRAQEDPQSEGIGEPPSWKLVSYNGLGWMGTFMIVQFQPLKKAQLREKKNQINQINQPLSWF